jgi:thymidylate synthase
MSTGMRHRDMAVRSTMSIWGAARSWPGNKRCRRPGRWKAEDLGIEARSMTGQMLGSQLDDILDDLIACPATRRAVAVLRGIGGERPCLDKLQFLVRDRKLLTVADFRSLDWGGAWPADFAGIRAIQRIICLGLDLAGIHIKPGPIVTQASSCHAYWDELLGWGFGPRA